MIMGLNISNQGINSLTLDARKPILGLQAHGDRINVFALGETHSYDQNEAKQYIALADQQVKNSARVVKNYVLRIVKIIKVMTNRML